jgi:hypothetical protein
MSEIIEELFKETEKRLESEKEKAIKSIKERLENAKEEALR